MSDIMGLFLSMLLLVFAVGTIIGGLFTIYFGSGRSRAIGAILLIIGLVVALVFYNYSGGAIWGDRAWDWEIVKKGIASLVGGIIGAVIAIGVFLAGIMKA
ncbi:MAG: hypothetical protein H5T44_03010 [Thermoplasmatales archaeon]|nr:hypothetical protein [Thermoplasmatales archaeon]